MYQSSKKRSIFLPAMQVNIQKVVNLNDVPSGSGISVAGDFIFIIGDDSPFIFGLDRDYRIVKKHLLLPEYAHLEKIPKAEKADFECMAEEITDGDPHLYIFGSGSKPNDRDTLIIFKITDSTFEKYSLTSFYNLIVAFLPSQNREDLNLEAAEIIDGRLLLFNRGTNSLFIIKMADFKRYLNQELPVEDLIFTIFTFDLPSYENVQAGFSGACSMPGSSAIIFTATMEKTTNWFDDGEIIGSFVGTIDLQNLDEKKVENVILLEKKNIPVKDKIEGISFKEHINENEMLFLAVSDNDEGSTKLFELKISF
jgi:hypothetical protein